jgi:hypothetical protein
MPTHASAVLLGRFFNADTPKKLLKSFGSFVVNISPYISTLFATLRL